MRKKRTFLIILIIIVLVTSTLIAFFLYQNHSQKKNEILFILVRPVGNVYKDLDSLASCVGFAAITPDTESIFCVARLSTDTNQVKLFEKDYYSNKALVLYGYWLKGDKETFFFIDYLPADCFFENLLKELRKQKQLRKNFQLAEVFVRRVFIFDSRVENQLMKILIFVSQIFVSQIKQRNQTELSVPLLQGGLWGMNFDTITSIQDITRDSVFC
ncbi:MAG: hypothetical protein PHT40_02545 [Patescibacteria group bacterium]|nr:hypothetical protein [Patescibacteria group bacterium]